MRHEEGPAGVVALAVVALAPGCSSSFNNDAHLLESLDEEIRFNLRIAQTFLLRELELSAPHARVYHMAQSRFMKSQSTRHHACIFLRQLSRYRTYRIAEHILFSRPRSPCARGRADWLNRAAFYLENLTGARHHLKSPSIDECIAL